MNDKKLTANELQNKYGHAHPKYAISTWRAIVYECDTIWGYWDWVVEEIAEEPTKYTFTVEIETTSVMNTDNAVAELKDMIAGNHTFSGVYSVTYNA